MDWWTIVLVLAFWILGLVGIEVSGRVVAKDIYCLVEMNTG